MAVGAEMGKEGRQGEGIVGARNRVVGAAPGPSLHQMSHLTRWLGSFTTCLASPPSTPSSPATTAFGLVGWPFVPLLGNDQPHNQVCQKDAMSSLA